MQALTNTVDHATSAVLYALFLDMLATPIHGCQMLEQEFSSLFHNQLQSVYLVHDTRAVDPLLRRYRRHVMGMLDLYEILASQVKRTGKPKMPKVTIRPTRWGPWAVELCDGATARTTLPKVQFQLAQLAQMRLQILEQQNHALDLAMAAAFATFTYAHRVSLLLFDVRCGNGCV